MKFCKDLGAGNCTYGVVLPYFMKDEDENGEIFYRPKTVCIDKCMLPEILRLWKLGIKTCHNCCGHTIEPATIGVNNEYIEAMEILGYKHYYDPNPEWRHDWIFKANNQPSKETCDYAEFIYEGHSFDSIKNKIRS